MEVKEMNDRQRMLEDQHREMMKDPDYARAVRNDSYTQQRKKNAPSNKRKAISFRVFK